jgi:hypothetical protein
VQLIEATDAKAWMEAELKRNYGEYHTAKFLLMPCLSLWRLVDIFMGPLGRDRT